MLSLYVPGASPVHRAPAGAKLAALAVLGAGLFAVPRLDAVAGLLAAVLGTGLLVARLPARTLWSQLRPVWLLLAALFAFHVVVTDVRTGSLAVLRLVALVLAAAVVTSTTRVTEMVAVVEWLARPLRAFGVRPARVGLVIAMTLRFIPVVADRAARIREAQAARGAPPVRLGLLVPLLISVLQMAHTLSEALDARGADDVPPGPGGTA